MFSIINENIYDMSLILKVKKQTGSKKLKKIIKNLRNLSKEDVKRFSELKIKKFEEENEIKNKHELKISAPTTGLQHYIEDFKKSDLRSVLNNDDDCEGEENTLSIIGDKEEVKQINSSDFSVDE